MPTLIMRGNVTYAQVGVQVPVELKEKAQDLGINLTQAAIAGITAEIERIEKRTKE